MNIGGVNFQQPVNDVREPRIVRRSARVRAMANMLPYESYAKRKAFFVGKVCSLCNSCTAEHKEACASHERVQERGVLVQEMPATNMQAKMMSDPSMMTNMLKSQLTGTAPHLLMGFLVNHFFTGFIMGKVPFTLTPRFRAMMQRGIDMESLDVSYFTSLSYYILLLFGLRGILALIFSGNVIDEAAVMSQSMKGANPAFDAKQEFKSESQRYDLVRIHQQCHVVNTTPCCIRHCGSMQVDHHWALEGAEARATKTLQLQLGKRPSSTDPLDKKQS
jgi:ER membrane protein complex subunit 3